MSIGRTYTLRRSTLILSILTILATLAASIGSVPLMVSAHARVASSTPAEGATIGSGLTQISILFTEDISVDQSTAQVIWNRDGSILKATAAVNRANRKQLIIQMAAPIGGGKYTIRWHAVTEEDNGITNGTINFTVSDCVTFKETGQTLCGRFLINWNDNGGLAQQGFPISGEMQEKSDTDGKMYKVQYFERSVFELHPENMWPNDVLLSLLGNFLYKQKYPSGAPNQKPNATAGSVLFNETGKRLGGKFLTYWQTHGGLAQQGFPISDEFQEKSDLDGKTYTVQYFERAVFELHPEKAGTQYEVLLSQLGTFRYKQKYPK
jgi:methionine-rich copper-binding protein CopC